MGDIQKGKVVEVYREARNSLPKGFHAGDLSPGNIIFYGIKGVCQVERDISDNMYHGSDDDHNDHIYQQGDNQRVKMVG
jgi:hypothetical protein